MKKHHEVSNIRFDDDLLKIKIDGNEHEFRLSEISKKLTKASDIEKNKYEISPSGYGIHWPLIDEDLSIDGLLGITHSPKKIKEVVRS
jgi:hypothetical protein